MTPRACAMWLKSPGDTANTASTTPTDSHSTAYLGCSCRRRESSMITTSVATALTSAMTWTPDMWVPPRDLGLGGGAG
jgi:hypothetical protein